MRKDCSSNAENTSPCGKDTGGQSVQRLNAKFHKLARRPPFMKDGSPVERKKKKKKPRRNKMAENAPCHLRLQSRCSAVKTCLFAHFYIRLTFALTFRRRTP